MKKVCRIDGCKSEHRAKGLCAVHYYRDAKYGDPNFTTRRPPNSRTKEDLDASKRSSYQRNKEKYREKRRKYDKDRYEKKKLLGLPLKNRSSDEGKAYSRFYCAKRRSIKIMATPRWLDNLQLLSIRELYFFAQKVSVETGVLHHVDHIVPLKGEFVCGLHVPWNLQVIPAVENIKKSNKHKV